MAYFEEHHEGSNKLAWVLILLFAAFILGWCMVLMLIIKSPPREWDFQVLPDAPSQSIYSTKDYKEQIFPPEQIERLPEASVPNDTTSKNKVSVTSPEDSVK
jgi:hypothetical protein